MFAACCGCLGGIKDVVVAGGGDDAIVLPPLASAAFSCLANSVAAVAVAVVPAAAHPLVAVALGLAMLSTELILRI